MTVRAKLQLVAITNHGGTERKTLRFEARCDQTIPEDQRFQKATPYGQVELQVDNPGAIEKFALGQEYYVDFSPVPAALIV
jgi:hypothetical protein